jgi:hypothetical protein
MTRVHLYDTTQRDGSQGGGGNFSPPGPPTDRFFRAEGKG